MAAGLEPTLAASEHKDPITAAEPNPTGRSDFFRVSVARVVMDEVVVDQNLRSLISTPLKRERRAGQEISRENEGLLQETAGLLPQARENAGFSLDD
jgi:hypothetical protein